jgi:hypothetical protein
MTWPENDANIPCGIGLLDIFMMHQHWDIVDQPLKVESGQSNARIAPIPN